MDAITMDDLPQMLASMRAAAKLSTRALGAMIDVSGASVTRLERGTQGLSKDMAVRWAAACGFELTVEAEPVEDACETSC